ncbi:MAG: DNA recombination protein RmuC [Bacteroidia bacterium]
MDISAWIVPFLLGAALSALGFWVWLSRIRIELHERELIVQQLMRDQERLQSESRQLAQSLEHFQAELRRYAEEKARLQGELEGLGAQLREKDRLLEKTHEDLHLLREAHDKAIAEISSLQVQVEQAQKNLEWRDTQVKQMEILFENLMQRIVQEGTQSLHARSQESLSSLLQPFREQLENLQKGVAEYNSRQRESIENLKGFIDRILQGSQKLSEQTENLTRALRGNIRVQGRWGEERLRELLELAGFEEGKHFLTQTSFPGEGKELFRPDIAFRLPDNRHIFIDAKVSLTAYDKYFEASTPEEQKKYQEALADSITNHVRELAKYQKVKVPHIGWTILFCPIEGALQLALQARVELIEEARKARVILAGPLILAGFIGLIEQLWQIEKRNRHAEEIAELAGKMLDKLRRFVEELEKVGKNLERARESYETARKYLVYGRDNVIATAHKLVSRGVSVDQPLPTPLVEEALAEEQRAELLLSVGDGEAERKAE